LILILSIVGLSSAVSPNCPAAATSVPTDITNHATLLSSRCTSTCTNCAVREHDLSPLRRCLSIVTSNRSDFSDLRKLKGVCVLVQANVVLSNPLILGDGDNCVTLFPGSRVPKIIAGDGDDYVYANGSSVGDIDLKGGNDFVNGNSSVLSDVKTGSGRDYVKLKSTTADKVDLGTGDDAFYEELGSSVTSVDAGPGSDFVRLNASTVSNSINGGSGSDVIIVNGTSSVRTIQPGSGSDLIGISTGATVGSVHNGDDDDDDSDYRCVSA